MAICNTYCICDHEILDTAFALKKPWKTHRNLVLKGLSRWILELSFPIKYSMWLCQLMCLILMPKSFSSLASSMRLPFKWRFKVGLLACSNFRCVAMSRCFVFFVLGTILFNFNQLQALFGLSCKLFWIWSMEWSEVHNVVSSAYISMFEVGRQRGRSLNKCKMKRARDPGLIHVECLVTTWEG